MLKGYLFLIEFIIRLFLKIHIVFKDFFIFTSEAMQKPNQIIPCDTR